MNRLLAIALIGACSSGSSPAEPAQTAESETSEQAEQAEQVEQSSALQPVDPEAEARRHQEREEAVAEARAAGEQAPEAGSLDFAEVGEGRPVVVLLHGYGARGDDLMPLAYRLHARRPARYILPAAPIEMPHGGRRWFGRRAEGIDAGELEGARNAVLKLLSDLQEEGVPSNEIVLGGFSQGAMLSLHVAERAPVGGLILLSGSTVAERMDAPSLHGVPVLVAHGRDDEVLPFRVSETIAERLRQRGAEVNWLPFDGGHTIPSIALPQILRLLDGLAAPEAAE